MEWQAGIVVACVVLAVVYIARATWRTWHPKPGGCGGGCGCATAVPPAAERITLIPADQLTVRRRP